MAVMTLSDMRFEGYSGAYAVEITSAGTYTFDNCYFDMSGTYAIEIDSAVTGDVTIILTNGSTILTTSDVDNNGSGGLTIFSTAIVSMTVSDELGVSVTGAYAYIDKDNTSPYIMNETTSTPDGVAEASWTGGAITGATWRVRKYGYKPYKAIADIPATGEKDIPVTLIVDPQQT